MDFSMFNPIKLIEEVGKRPLLYSIDRNPLDKEEKFLLWKEVGAEMFPDWTSLNKAEVYDRVLQLQRKWRSLRDAYNRELRRRRSENGANRRSYRYFKLMSFLGGFVGNISDDQNEDDDINIPINNTMEEASAVNEDSDNDPLVSKPKVKKQRKQSRNRKPKLEPISNEDDDQDNSKQEEELPLYMELNDSKDTDKQFLLSFLPEMKQLRTDIKMWARAQIAHVMQEAVSCQYNKTNLSQVGILNTSRIQRNDSTDE